MRSRSRIHRLLMITAVFVLAFLSSGSSCVERRCGEDSQCPEGQQCDIAKRCVESVAGEGEGEGEEGEGEGEEGEGEGEGEGERSCDDGANGGCPANAVCRGGGAVAIACGPCRVGYPADGDSCALDPTVVGHFPLDGTGADLSTRVGVDPGPEIVGLVPDSDRGDLAEHALVANAATDRLVTGQVDGLGVRYTVATWVRVDAFPQGTDDCRILTNETEASFATVALALLSDGRVELSLRDIEAGKAVLASDAALPVGGWTHVAVVVDGNAATIYLGGAPAGFTTSGTALAEEPGRTWSMFNNAPPSAPFRGALDEVLLFERPLDPLEIAAMADEPARP